MPRNPLARLTRRHRAACVGGAVSLILAWAGAATAATLLDEPLAVPRDRGGRGHGNEHGGGQAGGASQPATGPFSLAWQSGSVPPGVACVAVGDIDHDKLQDFVAQDWTGATGELLVYEDDGQGGFAEVARTSGASTWQVMACTTGDTDGDGLPEIIASYHGNTNVSVFEWSPQTGRYALVNTWVDGFTGHTGDLVTDLFVADTNGNGLQEIVLLAELHVPAGGTSSGTLITQGRPVSCHRHDTTQPALSSPVQGSGRYPSRSNSIGSRSPAAAMAAFTPEANASNRSRVSPGRRSYSARASPG